MAQAKNTDVTRIVLTEKQQRVFDKFDKNGDAVLSLEEYRTLRGTGLVDPSYGWFDDVKWPCSVKLTNLGLQLQAYQKQQRGVVAKDDRRYRINTIISATALGLSLIAIIVSILTATGVLRPKQRTEPPTAPTASPEATMAVTETVSAADSSPEYSAELQETQELESPEAAAPQPAKPEASQ